MCEWTVDQHGGRRDESMGRGRDSGAPHTRKRMETGGMNGQQELKTDKGAKGRKLAEEKQREQEILC